MIVYKIKDVIEKSISGEWGVDAEENNGVKVIRTTNFSNDGKLDLTKEVVIRKIEDKKIEQKALRIGDTIIEKSGGSPTQPVGRVVYFNETVGTFLCNNFTAILRPKEIVHPRYFFYHMYYQHKKNQTLKFQNKTTGIINLQLERYLDSTTISLPSLIEQKKIATILDKAQALIEKRKEAIAKLDELVQAVFLDMFGDPVKNERNFQLKKISEVCNNIYGGGTPSKSVSFYYIGEIPWVTPKDMKKQFIEDSIDHINENAIRNSSVKLVPKGSLLMVIRSGILKRTLPISINRCEVTINQDMKAFLPNTALITVEYLYFYFYFMQSMLLSKVRAVTADNIEFKQILELDIPIPTLEEQNSFISIFNRISNEKEKMEKSLASLQSNFQSLLQKAFKGELNIKKKLPT